MSETYAFLFCLGLGIAARFLYIGESLLAKRTDILPVTVILDTLTVIIVGGAFTLYVILTGSVLAPYMFASLFGGYFITYKLTSSGGREGKERKQRKPRKARK
ncbi:MAG: hypothetical protein K2M89_05795 [Clostridiales bacterium]|nr:hypothetical protein [Clostridiales bacterium]